MKRLLEVDDEVEENYDVLCIVGMGGLGKTTLAKRVFNHAEVANHFDLKIWVCISNVFVVARATKELIVKSGSTVDQLAHESLQRRRLREIVKEKKFLFVLDDVWSSREWEKMKVLFSLCKKGSKILVTTRNNKIAHAFGNKNPHHVQELNHTECMKIFKDNAFGGGEGEEGALVDKIVEACKGVPLVVKVIGSMLRFADGEKWEGVSKNAASWVNENVEIPSAIRFSYYDLPAFLKRCFEYLAMFPPDYEFDQDDVVRLWIADGSVLEVDDRKAENIGAEYYNELKARSLIQEEQKPDKMPNIVHHLASVMSRKFCYKKNWKNSPARVRHAFVDNWEEMHYEFLAQAPCLRTLIVQKCTDRNLVQKIIRSCNMLRTLKIGDDYHYAWNLSLGGRVIDQLTHIRYLNIPHSDRNLRDSLCMFNNLLFLAFNESKHLENLPDDVNHLSNLCFLWYESPRSNWALSELQILDLNRCKSLTELPKDIGNLRSLQNLYLQFTAISSLPESICALSELQTLDLNRCKSLTELPKDIGKLRSLRNLYLQFTAISSLPESICALSELQTLDLNGCKSLTELPKDIGNLRSLRNLCLRGTGISSLPESICALSELQTLNLKYCKSLTELPKDIGNLWSREELPVGRRRLFVINEEELLMVTIGGVEDALMADLKSKNIRSLHLYSWSQPGDDEEMEVKIMEALEPRHELRSLIFINYRGDNLPTWILPSNICYSNLRKLEMEGFDNICEMVDMEFVSLEALRIENCPKLEKVLMATPKLDKLYMSNCGELETVELLPSLSDKDGMHSIVSRLSYLCCDYNIFEYFFEKLKTVNSRWDKLEDIELRGGGRRFASLPRGWPSMMESLRYMYIRDILPGKFQLLPDGDQSAFPPSLRFLHINNREIKERLSHHSYTITSDGEVKSEK